MEQPTRVMFSNANVLLGLALMGIGASIFLPLDASGRSMAQAVSVGIGLGGALIGLSAFVIIKTDPQVEKRQADLHESVKGLHAAIERFEARQREQDAAFASELVKAKTGK